MHMLALAYVQLFGAGNEWGEQKNIFKFMNIIFFTTHNNYARFT